jgi:hypothetical protein
MRQPDCGCGLLKHMVGADKEYIQPFPIIYRLPVDNLLVIKQAFGNTVQTLYLAANRRLCVFYHAIPIERIVVYLL